MKKLKTTNAPSVILKLKNINPNSKIVLFNIAHLLKLKTTPTQALLMQMGGISESTVNRCLKELTEHNFIERVTKWNGKGKDTKIVINWPEINKHTSNYDWYEKADNTSLEAIEEVKPTPIAEVPTESIKTDITIEDIEEIMGITDENTGEVNNNYNFNDIDSKIPTANKMMALRQTRTYLSEEENMRRLNDALSIFLNGISNDDKYKYYNSILSQAV